MSLSSKGCYALVKFIENHKHGIVAELTTKRRNKYFRKGIDKKKDIYISDFKSSTWFIEWKFLVYPKPKIFIGI